MKENILVSPRRSKAQLRGGVHEFELKQKFSFQRLIKRGEKKRRKKKEKKRHSHRTSVIPTDQE